MNKTRILATSWHPGGANAIAPVIKKLKADYEVTVIGHGFSEAVFAKADIIFQNIKDFGLADVSVQSMKKLLKTVSPDLVLTGTSAQEGNGGDVVEQSITLAAKEMGIKTLAVLDFWLNYSQRFIDERLEGLSEQERLNFIPYCIAIMDEAAEQEMLEEGFPQEKLIITGNPYFDDLPAKEKMFTEARREEMRRKIKMFCNPLLFFAGTTFLAEKKTLGYWVLDVLELIAQVLPEFPGAGLAARLHPRMPQEDKERVKKFIAGSGARIKLIEDKDIGSQTLSLAADLTIVGYSTVAVEAVYLRRPCISLQPGLLGKDPMLISRKDIIPAEYNAEDCKDLLRQAMSSSNRSRFLEQSLGFSTDGKATGRVVKLVHSLVSL